MPSLDLYPKILATINLVTSDLDAAVTALSARGCTSQVFEMLEREDGDRERILRELLPNDLPSPDDMETLDMLTTPDEEYDNGLS